MYHYQHLVFQELEEPPLVAWEVEALIALAVILQEYTADDLSKMAVPNVHVRGIRVASLYIRSCTTMHFLVATCGFPVPATEVFRL